VAYARRVTHPNVARIFDVGVARVSEGEHELDVRFLTMELVRGHSLAEYISRHGPFAPEAALPIIEQMASALDAAHGAGLVHRDFKSSNIMLEDGEHPRVVVTDFGLARAIDGDASLSRDGAFIGTPAYIAPEQLEGNAAWPTADVYAFGVVLYEMVTGTLPFVAETPFAAAAMRLSCPPPPPVSRAPSLPAAWNEVILACLARAPEARHG
jgi:serine/threonine protein kinase